MFSLLRDSKVPPLSWLISLLVEGLPRVQELFILPSALLGVQVPSHFLSHFQFPPFLLTFVLPTYVKIFLLYQDPEAFFLASGKFCLQLVPHGDVFSMYLWD